MEIDFKFVSQQMPCVATALELAISSKVGTGRMIHGWSSIDPHKVRLHTMYLAEINLFLVPLNESGVAPMLIGWINVTKAVAEKHWPDVTYAKGYMIEGFPFDEFIDISVIEVEYHK